LYTNCGSSIPIMQCYTYFNCENTVETRYTALRYNRGLDILRVRVWIPKNLHNFRGEGPALIINPLVPIVTPDVTHISFRKRRVLRQT